MKIDATPITAAVTYLATGDGVPPVGSYIRDAADQRVAELIAEKVKALVQVNHELSTALPRNPCHFVPHREYVARAELFVFTRGELEQLIKQIKKEEGT